MKFEGKKLLILCGNVVHIKVVEAAKAMGVYTVVTDTLPLEAAPAKQIADEALYLNVLDVDGIVRYCRENKVDGVINYCNDIAQRPHQQICQQLGLPCYGNAEQFFQLTDKNAFKDLCRSYGVDVIPQYSEADISLERVEYPVLVKPVVSRGSRGQAICNNKEELLAALPAAKAESSNGQALIEKYMAGKQDFTISCVVQDGAVYPVRVADRYLGKESDNLSKQCICTVSPSKYTDLYMNRVHDRISNMFRGMGLCNAPVFLQGFVDGETVRFYDPGLRFPGGEYDQLLLRATGLNMMQSMIALALGEKCHYTREELEKAYLLQNHVALQMCITAGAGTVGRIRGLDQIRELPEVVAVTQRIFEGDRVENTGDVKQRFCEIALVAKKEDAKSVVTRIQSLLEVVDTAGNNMLVSAFDPELIS